MGSEDRHAGTLTDHLQLGDSAGTLEVAGDQHRGVSLRLEPLRELAREGGLTGTLQTGEHDDRRRGLRELQTTGLAAEDPDEFLVDDLDDLLGRVQRAVHLGALGAHLDLLDELAHDGQRDVGLEQGEADLTAGRVDVRVGQPPLAAQVLQDPCQPVGKGFEHRMRS